MILLTDTSSLAHRIFHTTTQFDLNGEPCGVPVGFLRSMGRICTELKESFFEPITKIACLDFGRCLWRTEMYPEYKAKRDRPKVHDFAPQMDTLERVLPDFGFQVCKAFGTEADDLIGVLAQEFETHTDERIVIVSSDKDLWQLITDRVRIYDLSRDMLIGPDQARELLGFSHERLVEYKALAGDSSDNIPGAKGVGEKTARKILEEHPDLRVLMADLKAREGTEGLSSELKKVHASHESVLLAGKLCTIAQFREQLWDAPARDAIAGDIRRSNG
jgi:DNA polymerase-1